MARENISKDNIHCLYVVGLVWEATWIELSRTNFGRFRSHEFRSSLPFLSNRWPRIEEQRWPEYAHGYSNSLIADSMPVSAAIGNVTLLSSACFRHLGAREHRNGVSKGFCSNLENSGSTTPWDTKAQVQGPVDHQGMHLGFNPTVRTCTSGSVATSKFQSRIFPPNSIQVHSNLLRNISNC